METDLKLYTSRCEFEFQFWISIFEVCDLGQITQVLWNSMHIIDTWLTILLWGLDKSSM